MTRAARVVLALVLALALAAAAVPAVPAGATLLVNETFSHGTPDNPNWLVGGMVATKSVSPCLTAGTRGRTRHRPRSPGVPLTSRRSLPAAIPTVRARCG